MATESSSFAVPTVPCEKCGGTARWCECDRGERPPQNCWECSGEPCPDCVDGQEPDPRVIEAAARAMLALDWPNVLWEGTRADTQVHHATRARAALLAAMRAATGERP